MLLSLASRNGSPRRAHMPVSAESIELPPRPAPTKPPPQPALKRHELAAEALARGDYSQAVKLDASTLRNVPGPALTRKMCYTAVAKDGLLLQHIPDDSELVTYHLCLTAVGNCGLALRWVPPEMRDAALCDTAKANDRSAVLFFPDTLRPDGEAVEVLKNHPELFRHAPEKLRTKAVGWIMLRHRAAAIRALPTDLLDPEMCRFVMERDPALFREIPEELFLVDNNIILCYH